MRVEPGKKVAVHYILRADGPEGEVIEQTKTTDPMEFVLGQDPMLPKFERALQGLQAGEKFTVAIVSADAYGDEDESLYMEFPKEMFIGEEGEFDEDMFQEGEVVPMQTPDGQEVVGVVAEVKLNSLVIDFNHPLAGQDLYFEGEIIAVG